VITGRENYIRTIEFKGPAYLPCELGVDFDWLWEKDEAKIERIRELKAGFPKDSPGWFDVARNKEEPCTEGGVTRWIDEWGTGWADDGHGAKPDIYPLVDGYAQFDSYDFPDPYLPGRFDDVDRKLAERGDRYARGIVWFTLFERFWMLRGFENALTDPYLDPANFMKLRDRILEYNLAVIDQLNARGVDGIYFSDDWGSQRALLINPDDWRQFYRPCYQAMFERVRSGGAHVWMHLCGNVMAILPDLIDLGLNVLNPVQPQAMDVRVLAREFGGKLCFCGGVDVQGTLVHSDPEGVRREVHALVDLFGRYNGGYIGATSHTIMPETPLDNIIALFEVFREYQQSTSHTTLS
jgi:uroporphyrinogen decarboxylase